jgi:hypothetical protein
MPSASRIRGSRQPNGGARAWSPAAAATRTSTRAGPPGPTRNDHWRAGCGETRKPCSGRDPRKRTRPRAPRRRSTSLEAAGAGNGSELAMVTAAKRPAGGSRGKVAAGPDTGQMPPGQLPTLHPLSGLKDADRVASCPARQGQHRSLRRMRTGVRAHDPQMLVAGIAVAAWPSRGSA